MTDRMTGRPERPIRAPHGRALPRQGRPREAARRVGNLDPDVAERSEDLVVSGGSGKAARNPEACHRKDGERLARWLRLAQDRVSFHDLPARVRWPRHGAARVVACDAGRVVRGGRAVWSAR